MVYVRFWQPIIREFFVISQLSNYEIVNTKDNVKDEDNASTILRSRKNSSIYKALEYVKNNENSGFVSAGNTAAIMILSRLNIGMIEGIDRPAICTALPTKTGLMHMLDLGANIECDENNLVDFSEMGAALFLSLIHISRCRLRLSCRSRWSPYH